MRMDEAHYIGDHVREEPVSGSQERALALYSTQLLQERKRDHLRVREPFERLVASKMWVEKSVGVVDEAEEPSYHFFQIGERGVC
jgi:hypothetical protein